MINELKGYLDKGWKTKNEILYFLNHFYKQNVDERTLRTIFAEFNERYEKGETELFIAHSSRGYLLTADQNIILSSLQDDYKRALKLLKRYYRCKSALSEKKQLSLMSKEETDLYEVIMKME